MYHTRELQQYLNKIKIHKGDIIHIPSGTVHSVSGYAELYEVQRNCNITYRVYDKFNRKLDIERAVQNFKNNSIKIKNKQAGVLIKNKYYILERLNNIENKIIETKTKSIFLTIISGIGRIITKEDIIDIKQGMTLLIPAKLRKIKIMGKDLDILKTTYK